jgi:transcriptional regulator with XRE-family HTH domain
MRASKLKESYVFRGSEFYDEVAKTLSRRGMSWRQLALEIGATSSTFTRWARGRSLDGGTLAALSAWAGLDPADFVGSAKRSPANKPLDELLSALREDSSLTPDAADILTVLLTTLYDRLRAKRGVRR